MIEIKFTTISETKWRIFTIGGSTIRNFTGKYTGSTYVLDMYIGPKCKGPPGLTNTDESLQVC